MGENAEENKPEENLNNDKKARDSEEELENKVPENTSETEETEEKEEPEVEEEKPQESTESEDSENSENSKENSEDEEKESSDENESSEENKSSEVDGEPNSNTDTPSKVIEDFDKQTTQEITDEQDKLDSIKNKLAQIKERQDRKNKKIMALKDETEGLDDEIAELTKEQ